jgi:hypothetical protein
MGVKTTGGARPRVGFLRPDQVERAFVGLLYLALALLVALSVLGTFYGRRGAAAPITDPVQIATDALGDPGGFGIAIAIQATLTVVQYGARQKARDDRRWWILYLVALGWSVYYNIQAYWTPLTALTPWYLAGLLIVAGDVLPEFLAVRRE